MINGQASLEYLAVLALTLVILVPSIYIFFNYSQESKDNLIDKQLSEIGDEIIENIKTVYYSGEGSKLTLHLNIPDNVNEICVQDSRELVFVTNTNIGESETVFFSDVVDMRFHSSTPVSTDTNDKCFGENYLFIPSGKVKLKIEAIPGKIVEITKI